MPKATKAVKEARVNAVYTRLLNGATRWQILQYASKQRWGLSARQVDTYVAEANAMLAAEAEWHRGRELGKAVARLNDVYQKSMLAHEYGRAIAAQRELNTLLGLHAPPPVQTLKILGIDHAEAETLAEALKQHGLKASDVFQAMLTELVMHKAATHE